MEGRVRFKDSSDLFRSVDLFPSGMVLTPSARVPHCLKDFFFLLMPNNVWCSFGLFALLDIISNMCMIYAYKLN